MKQNPVRKILDFLYPNVCPCCGTFLFPEEMICETCAEKMILEQDGYCHQCGKINCLCKYQKLFYDKAVVSCRYADETVPAVICLKTGKNTNFAYFSARILAERLKHGSYYGEINYVMPVPMHKSKQRKRGYNQAALIAKEIASILNLPYREDILYKKKSGKEQHKLASVKERSENVSTFAIHDISLEHQRILLCDDVLTTCSTMNRCAELLRQNHASAVIAAAAATTVPKKKEEENG